MIGRAYFGSDWIGQLSPADTELLKKHGPQDTRLSGDLMEMIQPLPTKDLADRVDRALGRYRRMIAQWNTAKRLLVLYGPPARFGVYDTDAVKKMLRRYFQKIEPEDLKRPGRGPRAVVFPRVLKAMRAAVDDGEYTFEQLIKEPSKRLGHRFGCGKTFADEARKQILAAISQAQKATSDK
jgi:hypothetical protein